MPSSDVGSWARLPGSPPAPPSPVGTRVFALSNLFGVAVGDEEIRLAHPLETIDAGDNATRFARIAALIAEWRPVALVVGLPLSLDGDEHEMTQRCRRFAHQLHGRFNLPGFFVDERLTSAEAASRLRARRVSLVAFDETSRGHCASIGAALPCLPAGVDDLRWSHVFAEGTTRQLASEQLQSYGLSDLVDAGDDPDAAGVEVTLVGQELLGLTE